MICTAQALEDNSHDVDATVEFLIGMKAIGQDEHWDLPHSPDQAGARAMMASSSSSTAGSKAEDLLASVLASSDPEKKCPCGSGKLFKACCMKRLQASVSGAGCVDDVVEAHASSGRKRGATPPPAPAAASAADPIAAKFPAKLSNRERKEQQRQEKQREQDEMGGIKRDKGKVKTRPGADPAAAATIKVVGI